MRNTSKSFGLIASALIIPAALASRSDAAAIVVPFNTLNASTTVATPFGPGDTLIVDTVVNNATGALTQNVTFTVAAPVDALVGETAWEVSTAAGPGPRLTGVNMDIVDGSNTLVTTDTFVGVLGGFAHSSFSSAIAPGTYTLKITGIGVRESVLDVSINFVTTVPEPHLAALGLGAFGLLARRGRAIQTI
jgi:hypothetical protein